MDQISDMATAEEAKKALKVSREFLYRLPPEHLVC
jgi:hypothetical protein